MFSAGGISPRLTAAVGRAVQWTVLIGCAWAARLTSRPGKSGSTISLIDAAPATGSLLNSALSDCLLELCTAGFYSTWTFCITDSVLLAGFVLSVLRVNGVVNMAADSAALVEVRAGITFGVELYVP